MPRMPEKRPGAGSLLIWTAPPVRQEFGNSSRLTAASGDDVTPENLSNGASYASGERPLMLCTVSIKAPIELRAWRKLR
jgi:hypothetical protein